MANINDAYNYVIQACNDPNIGYSKGRRTTIKLNSVTKTYCDCSSLMSWALTRAGYFQTNPWFNTRNMEPYLLQIGFKKYPASDRSKWKNGAIVWYSGHTEMVYDAERGYTMGAHTDKAKFQNQVCIGSSSSGQPYPRFNDWSYIYTTDGEGIEQENLDKYEWVTGNRYLPTHGKEQQNNAICFYREMTRKGVSFNSICAMLGNIQQESTINPGIWQSLKSGATNLGYGLVQWTPASGFFSSLSSGEQRNDGNVQCKHIFENNPTKWVNRSDRYDYTFMSMSDFFSSDQSISELTKQWLYSFESPANATSKLAGRVNNAQYWAKFLYPYATMIGDWGEGDAGSSIRWGERQNIQYGGIMQAKYLLTKRKH